MSKRRTLKVSTFSRTKQHDRAVEGGFFRAEDLDIELDMTQASKTQMSQLVDGVWDLVHTNFDNVLYWSEDHDAELLIVSAVPGTPRQDLVVRPEIKTYADLKGKIIAVDAAESGYVTPLRVMLQAAGLKEGDDYTMEEFGATDGRVGAMDSGKAYAAMVSEGRKLENGLWVMDNIKRLYTHYASIIVTRRAWAEQNEDLVVRYLRAHVAAAGSLSGEAYPAFDWDGMREMMEMRNSVGYLRGPVDPTRFATTHYFDKAL
jgi:ABC-type nitrate/sulfonate/bicarbonate transport system substrate-binding protein